MDHTLLAKRIRSLLEECDDLTDVDLTQIMENATEVACRDDDGNAFTITVADFE